VTCMLHSQTNSQRGRQEMPRPRTRRTTRLNSSAAAANLQKQRYSKERGIAARAPPGGETSGWHAYPPASVLTSSWWGAIAIQSRHPKSCASWGQSCGCALRAAQRPPHQSRTSPAPGPHQHPAEPLSPAHGALCVAAVPAAHRMRCSAVQIRRKKYPITSQFSVEPNYAYTRHVVTGSTFCRHDHPPGRQAGG
jgi:hypothetical protein